jgi:hypothetical protein
MDGETLSLAGWVVDTVAAESDDTAIESVDVFAGAPGSAGIKLASGTVSATAFRIEVPQAALQRGVARLALVARTRDGLMWSRTLGAIIAGPIPPPVRLPPPPPTEPIVQPVLPPRLEITSPQPGATISAGHLLQGVVLDPSAPVGAGVSRVDVFMEPGRDAGGRLVGSAAPSGSGFSVVLRLPRGTHTLYVHAQSSSGRESVVALSLSVS